MDFHGKRSKSEISCLGCILTLIFMWNCLNLGVAKQATDATISILNIHMETEVEMGEGKERERKKSRGREEREGRKKEGGKERGRERTSSQLRIIELNAANLFMST